MAPDVEGPRQRNSSATRARIMEAATVLLRTVGPEKFSVREVARHVELTVPAIHHYFDSRDGLLNAVVDVFYAEVENGAKAILTQILVEGSKGDASLSDILSRAALRGFRLARRNRMFMTWLTLDAVKKGHLDAHRQNETQLPFLKGCAAALAAQSTVSEVELRLRLHTIILTIARYAVIDEEELEEITGAPNAVDLVERHIALLSQNLLTFA